MRTLVAGILVALFMASPVQALTTDPGALLLNHEKALDALLDSTDFLDEYLGPFGSCMRQSTVDTTKDLYGTGDRQQELTTCSGGDCARPTPGDPFLSVKNCEEMIIEIVEEIVGTLTVQYVEDTSTGPDMA